MYVEHAVSLKLIADCYRVIFKNEKRSTVGEHPMNVHHLDGASRADFSACPAPDAKHEICNKLTRIVFMKDMMMAERRAGSTSLTKVKMDFRSFRAKGTCTKTNFSMCKQRVSTSLPGIPIREYRSFLINICQAELCAIEYYRKKNS